MNKEFLHTIIISGRVPFSSLCGLEDIKAGLLNCRSAFVISGELKTIFPSLIISKLKQKLPIELFNGKTKSKINHYH